VANSSAACAHLCHLVQGCQAWTWRQFTYSCFALTTCDEEDLECGVCTSGSSCELGWGARVDPTALNVELGPRQPGATPWMTSRDVSYHQNSSDFSVSSGRLSLASHSWKTGSDIFGHFAGLEQTWKTSNGPAPITTSLRSYLGPAGLDGDLDGPPGPDDQGDQGGLLTNEDWSEGATIFSQHFPDGLPAAAVKDEDAKNRISTCHPCLEPEFSLSLSQLSFGGFMAGWAALTVTDLDDKGTGIRTGEYGGPLVLFDEQLENVVIISSLNNFMVSSMEFSESKIKLGLMGSVTEIPKGETLEFLVVYANTLRGAFTRWGAMLRQYNGKATSIENTDLVTNYLGYWMDNGAYYYYNPLPNTSYQDTVLELHANLSERIPVRYVNYDSWWYLKGEGLGVKDWSPMPEIFPDGLHYLFNQTGWGVAAHNRYWAPDNVYSKENGGKYNFLTEKENLRALPADPAFWKDFFNSTTAWGLDVYEQDWQDRQFVDMDITHTSFVAGKHWLEQMGAGAEEAGITLQYCMSLPREVLQSSAVSAARRLRASGDYILSKDNWRIGITGLLAQSLGLVPFKNVFWSSRRNPGNKFYYNCMEVNEDVDPNQPWSLKYRYTGYMNTTKSGHNCLAWSDLDLHWEFPEGDLERDGCRSMAVYPESDPANGLPFCYYQADTSKPQSQWLWEKCDIPICENTCNRPGLGNDTSLPPCQEYVEDNPRLQAVVSLMSGGGVGVGDRLDTLDTDLVLSTCRSDGRLLSPGRGLTVTPVQLSRMAKCPSPTSPTSCSGELWTGETVYSGEKGEALRTQKSKGERRGQIVEELHFGVIFIADGSEAINASYRMLGWDNSKSCQATLLYSSYEDHKLFICENGSSPILPLPAISSTDFLILHTAPRLAISGGFHLFLLGELSKLGVISPARLESIDVGDGSVSLKILGQVDEVVGMTWVWTDGEKSESKVTTCTVGQDETVTMELFWTEDNLFNNVTCIA